ncbi:hypothetical protein ACHHYP_10668 [Achlya hypogyna]|uniref:Uncharacterized protein n=1 Tax=Achlya hypogyna TaxID=1202772 RepID=A0A1V9YKW3_ACHHY|nr:hypothetical protein ACHHYP_10668 [Achlya hypogyna]
MQEACTLMDIAYDPRGFKDVLWDKLAEHALTVEPVVVTMAAARGHEVLFTTLGRRVTVKIAPSKSARGLDDAFLSVTPKAMSGCVKKAKMQLEGLNSYLVEMDEISGDSNSSAESAEDEGADADEISLPSVMSQGKVPLWIDETNFNLITARTKGRAPRNGRAVAPRRAPLKGKNLRITDAISNLGYFYREHMRGSYRNDRAYDGHL